MHAPSRAGVGARADQTNLTVDVPWPLQLAAIGRIRGRRFVFDSDALDKLAGSAWFSSRKIESMLGFRPKWNLERALPEMVEEARRA